VYVWQAPLQLRSSLTVYWMRGVWLFVCAPAEKLFAWQPAQSGLYAANGYVTASELPPWHFEFVHVIATRWSPG